MKARKCLCKTKIGIIRKVEGDSQNKKQEFNNENEDLKSCNHKTRKEQLRHTQMKNRANVYKLHWDLGKKTEVTGTFTVNTQDTLTNTLRKFKHKKGRMDHGRWMWTGQPRYGQI